MEYIEFCEDNIRNEVKSILRSKAMHMITINNATCDTGHLHVSSLIHSEHRHCQDYKINYRLYLVIASAKSLHLMKDKLKHTDNMKTYLKNVIEDYSTLIV